MLIYVAHAYQGSEENLKKAKKKTHDLQICDYDNTYICPLLALSHLKYGEIGYDDEMELCLDILSNCERIIIASEITDGVRREIDFANLVKMEVLKLEDNGALRPFKK